MKVELVVVAVEVGQVVAGLVIVVVVGVGLELELDLI